VQYVAALRTAVRGATMRLIPFLRLVRFEYSLFTACGIVVSGLISGDLRGVQREYCLAFLVVWCTVIASFALNDYCDRAIDARNARTDRPLVSGRLAPRTAVLTAFTGYALALVGALFLNRVALGVILLGLPLFVLYSIRLKALLLVKNLVIACAFVATITVGAIVADGRLEPIVQYFAGMGFLVGFAFEVMLDIGDVRGDAAEGVDTVATRFGTRAAATLVMLLYALVMVLDPLPFFVVVDPLLFHDPLFLLLISLPVASYGHAARSLIRDASLVNVARLQRQLFLTMQIGSVAYVVGILF
jgi:geranylgeranylglycerol-phosphate geranylgeranyltransferase